MKVIISTANSWLYEENNYVVVEAESIDAVLNDLIDGKYDYLIDRESSWVSEGHPNRFVVEYGQLSTTIIIYDDYLE